MGKRLEMALINFSEGLKKWASLHQAAKQMGMSYSKAWRLIRTLEERLGFTLLERKVGGLSGRRVPGNPQGKDLMNHYGRFRRDVEKGLEKIYQNISAYPPAPP